MTNSEQTSLQCDAPSEADDLVFALVGPIGTNLEYVEKGLSLGLKRVGYEPHVVHVTKLIEEYFDRKSLIERMGLSSEDDLFNQSEFYKKIMLANAICKISKDNSILAALSISEINKIRQVSKSNKNNAFIIRQLKRKDEVDLLREIYGKRLIQVSSTMEKSDRIANLKRKLRSDPSSISEKDIENTATKIMQIDEDEGIDHGQNVGEIFHTADFFTYSGNENLIYRSLQRFIDALFGRNNIGPTMEEYGTYLSFAASFRSCDLSRQTGAAIIGRDGEILSLGCNEVPKAGGGQYWDDDLNISRDIDRGSDANKDQINRIIQECCKRILNINGIKKDKVFKNNIVSALSESLIGDITEYGRITHAEMTAICEAARTGRKLRGATMYATTFPCHNCAKHIIASGISKVVFIEPYPKSHASTLHDDAISFSQDSNQRVIFKHFEGISPRRYRDIFQKFAKRKNSNGGINDWYENNPRPRLDGVAPFDQLIELKAIANLKKSLKEISPPGLQLVLYIIFQISLSAGCSYPLALRASPLLADLRALSRRRATGAPRMSVAVRQRGTVTAVLGPTNTGKTTYAIDRMLGHKTGVMGFPLRLLAREVYDRIVGMRGPSVVALVTGEEKIAPPNAKYFICTVESMPLEQGADFVAVDEIQLCADPERGHVFTERLLNARGMHETLFLGAMTMRDKIAGLIPGVQFAYRDRFSELSYAGSKKVSRLPARSAVVAFSTDQVYAIAELIRRQKGGAAVVMGALSPRTRNAQVAMFQEGEVEYLVATDAIGMGLNLDLKSVWFAGAAKFDGRRHRKLEPQELAQIAGRAGRYKENGSFGVTGECAPFDPEVVEAIEEHQFHGVGALQWRNSKLSFANPDALLASLELPPPARGLQRARESEDIAALRLLAADTEVRRVAKGVRPVRLLWDVCQVPDFRKTMLSEHVELLKRIYGFLTRGQQVIPQDWIAAQVLRIDRTEGDIDALSKRLAYVRTWTYAANRSGWVENAQEWREKTRAVEDRLSDALHARLTQRFVDRRTSVLMRRLKQREELVAEVDKDGGVTVEGEHVGRIEGLRFQPDREADGIHAKTLRAASTVPVAAELTRRVEKLYAAPDGEISFTEQGGIVWDNVVVGRMEAGADPLSPVAKLFADELLEQTSIDRAERRMNQWLERRIATLFEPLLTMRDDEAITGLARGVAFQLVEGMGVLPRGPVAQDVKALEQEQRSLLRRHGLRFGQYTLFMPALLKPAPTRLRIVLWGLSKGMDEIPAPPQPGVVTMPAPEGVPNEFFQMAGYRKAGNRALRLDMLERLADLIRPLNAREGFEATGDMLSITGLTMEQFAELLDGLGYRSEKGERPKPRPAKPGEMAFALEDGTEVTLTAYGAEEATPAEPAMESFYTFRILPRGRRQQGEGNQGRRPPRNRNAGGGGGGQGKPAEAGAPARNEGGGRRNGRAAEGGGEGGGQKRRQEGGGGRQRFDKKFGEGGGGKRGGPKRDQPKREFSASPPRHEKKIDPDSPFAILQQLKDRKQRMMTASALPGIVSAEVPMSQPATVRRPAGIRRGSAPHRDAPRE